MSSLSFKLIAVVSMIIDHIGSVYFPGTAILRIIGRLALPLFCYQIAVGFEKTRDRKKYMKRLLITAIIAQLPYSYYFGVVRLNIIFALLIGCFLLYEVHNRNMKLGGVFIILACMLTFKPAAVEYGWYSVVLVYIFHELKDRKIKLSMIYILLTGIYIIETGQVLQAYSLAGLILIMLHNGKEGYKLNRALYYAIYPMHLIVLLSVKLII